MSQHNDKAVLFIGADRPVPGKEGEAYGIWTEMNAWLGTQQKNGWFTRWDNFFLTAHGGDLNCAIVCYGDRAKLDEWRRTDEFEGWVFKLSNVLSHFGIVPGVTGEGIQQAMTRRAKIVGNR
jgi:hypothetical protein